MIVALVQEHCPQAEIGFVIMQTGTESTSKDLSDRLRHGNYVISTHWLTYGAAQALREYLLKQECGHLCYISHPLIEHNTRTDDHSYVEISVKGDVLAKIERPKKVRNLLLNFLFETYLTVKWCYQSSRKRNCRYDVFFGSDNLNAFAGLMLKKMRVVKKVVYYTIDYFPTRFSNRLLNRVYHAVDKWCVCKADETWNVGARMAQARAELNNMHGVKYSRQFVVPMGVWYKRAKRKSFEDIDKRRLVFVGHMVDYAGLELAVSALPAIIQRISGFSFHIVGGGGVEQKIRELVSELELNEYVKFYGWVQDRTSVEEIISSAACGMALFNKDLLDDKVRNADPAKVKDYMLMGLPVITTDELPTAREIEKAGAGIVIPFADTDFAEAVIQLMSNEESLRSFRDNALQYVKQFDYTTMFNENVARILHN